MTHQMSIEELLKLPAAFGIVTAGHAFGIGRRHQPVQLAGRPEIIMHARTDSATRPGTAAAAAVSIEAPPASPFPRDQLAS